MVLCLVSVSLLVTVAVHEGIHWLVAILLGYDARYQWHRGIPSVTYQNKGNHVHHLLIASSAPLLLFLTGCLWSATNLFTGLIKVFCLSNVFNLLPITNDGEIIFLSLYKLLERDL